MIRIIRVVSKIYDPLGMLSPFVICGKILIQEIWKEKFHWDNKLQ